MTNTSNSKGKGWHLPAAIAAIAVVAVAALMGLKPAHAATSDAPQTISLPSGVVVTPLSAGNGQKPNAHSRVEVHYRGTFEDGREFDSSFRRGEPITFPLSGVIPCWTEGVQQMSVGQKAKLFCPSATAYGARGAGSSVPPNSDLYFEVHLLKVTN